MEDQTPEYEHYSGHAIEEDQDNAYEEGLPNNNDLNLVSMPDAGHNYISAEVLLPLGGVLQQGKVISHKHNADRKTVGRANERPSLTHSVMSCITVLWMCVQRTRYVSTTVCAKW
jgi:hypothetical protein